MEISGVVTLTISFVAALFAAWAIMVPLLADDSLERVADDKADEDDRDTTDRTAIVEQIEIDSELLDLEADFRLGRISETDFSRAKQEVQKKLVVG